MGAEQATQHVEIGAPREIAFEALTDYEHLAEWQSAIDELEVTERHPDGMGEIVSYKVDLKVKKIEYTLRYSYDAPGLIRYELVEGDIKDVRGTYEFEELGPDRCAVTATIAVDPGRFVPGPVRKMLAGQMLKGTLSELRDRAERSGGV